MTTITSWPSLCRPSRCGKARRLSHRDHRHEAGDDVEHQTEPLPTFCPVDVQFRKDQCPGHDSQGSPDRLDARRDCGGDGLCVRAAARAPVRQRRVPCRSGRRGAGHHLSAGWLLRTGPWPDEGPRKSLLHRELPWRRARPGRLRSLPSSSGSRRLQLPPTFPAMRPTSPHLHCPASGIARAAAPRLSCRLDRFQPLLPGQFLHDPVSPRRACRRLRCRIRSRARPCQFRERAGHIRIPPTRRLCASPMAAPASRP